MKVYRDDVRRHAVAAGRNPDDVKVLFLVYPILGETDEEAHARHRRMVNSPGFVEAALAAVGTVTDIDFSAFGLDAPLPHLATNGEQGSLDKFAQWGSGNAAATRAGAVRCGDSVDRVARYGCGRNGKGDGGDWGRRISDQHPVPAGQPALRYRSL
jgi:alkanesulfonate monooxygenase SsuD/methylene tetrahydromethanopterin reductase-like flavin-dependent oxidoreductase (luciferase family)